MKIPIEFMGRYFYHFTHIDNLNSIIKNGLLSTNRKIEKGLKHVNIASEEIQQRRSEMTVSCFPQGKIHDYVPFYFTARNPMLLSVLNRKNIDQPQIVYIAVSIDRLLDKNVIFTDASANTVIPPCFYNDPIHLDKLDWNLINSSKWTVSTSDELHSRMAEVLIFTEMPINWIDAIIVYNESSKNVVEEIYKINNIKLPKIEYQPFDNRHFYFTKFFIKGREKETLITGPSSLANKFSNAIIKIVEEREKTKKIFFKFVDITDALNKIGKDFCVLKELNDIFGLRTDNKIHRQNVSDHTIQVVQNLENNGYYQNLVELDKKIVKLSAYFHDIGKGPKTKWNKEIQKAYPDHPADAIPMLERILIEDFESVTEYEIRKICLLVVYHDLIGDIIRCGRSKEELLKLEIDNNELNMLISISLADISAINFSWHSNLRLKLPTFVNEIKKKIL